MSVNWVQKSSPSYTIIHNHRDIRIINYKYTTDIHVLLMYRQFYSMHTWYAYTISIRPQYTHMLGKPAIARYDPRVIRIQYAWLMWTQKGVYNN